MAATRALVERRKHKKPPHTSSLKRPRRNVRRKLRRAKLRGNRRHVNFQEGFSEGYRQGVQSGIQSYPVPFEGTSIVIPTFNQLNVLRQCIDSIIQNTNIPYEIIVVDNASVDGTAAYLQKLSGLVRYRILDHNRGFAGAINMGLMMTKGRTIVLLNNDTIVTENWLDNLLTCLNNHEDIGMVGPITNYISGEQQIDVPYANISDMPKFARENNKSDPARWRQVDQLTGFCLLFKRELFEGVGYFDEGFEIGNFEDNDYNIRVGLLGKKMVIAQDSFIHHIGSVSIKALGERFVDVNTKNELYYSDKWSDPHEWVQQAQQRAVDEQGSLAHTAYYYPENIVVQAIGPNEYWIEKGTRRLVMGSLTFPSTRVSQIDLRRWPQGEPIAAEEVEERWRGLGNNGSDVGVVTLTDGVFYHVENDKVRRIISLAAMQGWQLHLKPLRVVEPELLEGLIQGLPIISPPMLKQML